MLLFLMRHGQATPAGPGTADAERPLTDAGARQVGRIATALQRQTLPVTRLVSSRYRRARETAALIADALGHPAETDALIAPEMRLGDLAELVARTDGRGGLYIVGHQPATGRLIRELTGANVVVAPATIAVLDVHRVRSGGGTLVGLFGPGWLERWGGD